jgi:hypothetical protein
MTEKKKKTSFWAKLTTEDWMAPKQLKAYTVMRITVEAVLCFVVFVVATFLFSVAVSTVIALIAFILATSIIMRRTRRLLRLKTGQ